MIANSVKERHALKLVWVKPLKSGKVGLTCSTRAYIRRHGTGLIQQKFCVIYTFPSDEMKMPIPSFPQWGVRMFF